MECSFPVEHFYANFTNARKVMTTSKNKSIPMRTVATKSEANRIRFRQNIASAFSFSITMSVTLMLFIHRE